MDLSQFNLFRMFARRMDYLRDRQEVIAQNVANVDTPGYRPRDLEPFERVLARESAAGLPMATTDAAHIPAAGGTAVGARAVRDRSPAEVEPSGNAVKLDEQLLAAAETAQSHQVAVNLYRKHLGMIRAALGPRA